MRPPRAVKHKPHTTTEFHDALRSLGASTKRAVYLTQDRQFEEDYRAYCASIGFESPVVVLNHDYWVWCAFSHYERDGEEVFQKRLEAFRARPSRRKRRFVSLNRTARERKDSVLAQPAARRTLGSGLCVIRRVPAPGRAERRKAAADSRGSRAVAPGIRGQESPNSRRISMRSMRVAEYCWA